MSWVSTFSDAMLATFRDIFPIAMTILVFQLFVLRWPIPHLKRVLVGFFYVMLGMVFFLEGLEKALFPLGRLMAGQLADPEFIYGGIGEAPDILLWKDYGWVYLFAAALGFSTTLAEPALIAVAKKAHLVSGGAVSVWGLRGAVAIGAAIGVSLGSLRIVTGTPLHYYIIAGYVIVIVQTFFAPRMIVPLAFDSGGVTTSTVTVPLVAALGLGLAAAVPGRSPVMDGFGLIAFACLFPIITVMGYAQVAEWWVARGRATRQRVADKVGPHSVAKED